MRKVSLMAFTAILALAGCGSNVGAKVQPPVAKGISLGNGPVSMTMPIKLVGESSKYRVQADTHRWNWADVIKMPLRISYKDHFDPEHPMYWRLTTVYTGEVPLDANKVVFSGFVPGREYLIQTWLMGNVGGNAASPSIAIGTLDRECLGDRASTVWGPGLGYSMPQFSEYDFREGGGMGEFVTATGSLGSTDIQDMTVPL
ncbi:MAG TPA: hypothetical protein V6C97_26465, partial [Oculatellaceae cyanobacterium]